MNFAILMFAIAQPLPAAAWALDELVHHNGSTFKGIILGESEDGVRFQVVTRTPGRPTVTLTTLFTKSEVARLNRLTEKDRADTKAKLAELDPTGKGERERMDALKLTATDWLGQTNSAKRYESDHFILVSNASEEITRRAAVRLEQLFSAFRRYFPPRNPNGRPTTIFLATTPDDYRAILGPSVPKLLNPAVFDPANNRIVCGSDLRRFGEELTGTRIFHQRQRVAIDQYEADVRKLYKDHKADLDRFLATITIQRQRIVTAEAANEKAFDLATKQLFAVLYHEAFHAYIASYAYPEQPFPRWLNEGLAQIFETAIVEAGELNIGHADPERLKYSREILKPNSAGIVSIHDLIRANGNQFLAQHTETKTAVDRVYVSSWAAAHYLLFTRGAIANSHFVDFLKARQTGTDSIKEFEKWVGLNSIDFDVKLRDYISTLK